MALTDNLLAFYKLSDLTDSSGNNLTLTNNNGVSFASGKIGNAAVFNGTNSLEKAPFNIGQNFTVSFWANLNEVIDYGWLLLQYGGFCIYTRQDGSIEVGDAMSWSFATAAGVVETGVWKHYCLSVSNGVGTLYLNNSVLGNSEGNPPLDLSDTGDRPFGIAGESVSNNGYFNCSMDAVGVWDRALNSTEAAVLYNNGTGLELPAVKNGWINNIYWINDVATSLDQNGDGVWVGKLYDNGSLFSGSKYGLTYVNGVAQAEAVTTETGSNVSVSVGQNDESEPIVQLVFASITSSGQTTVEQIVPTSLPAAIPAKYTVAQTLLAYSIDTTATFSGPINVDFTLPSNISLSVFNNCKAYHIKNDDSVEEMTRVSSDFSTKRITVTITSFSDFIFLAEPPPQIIYSPGLVGIEYNGYFDGNPTWFATATPTGTTELRTEFTPVLPTPNNGYSWEWTGYFKPLSAEGFIEDDFTFLMISDDIGIMWIGDVAVSGYTTSNRLVSAYGPQEQSTPISLRADTHYPVRIQFGHPVPPTAVSLYIEANPTRRQSNDFVEGCLFNASLPQSVGKMVKITGKTKLFGKVKINA
jgi:hypothetical protein